MSEPDLIAELDVEECPRCEVERLRAAQQRVLAYADTLERPGLGGRIEPWQTAIADGIRKCVDGD